MSSKPTLAVVVKPDMPAGELWVHPDMFAVLQRWLLAAENNEMVPFPMTRVVGDRATPAPHGHKRPTT